MSLSQQKIPESKSKSKFQSLNINNLYQGAASRPQSKGPPQKHGLQSLGKVPTARRAPANLPSVKSEKGGNDPTVVLVPTGGGWASKEGEEGRLEGREGSREPQPPAKEEEKTPPRPQQPLSWAGTVTGGSGGSRPKLGSNFPALPGETGRPEEANSSSAEAPAPDPAYGPGPSLRPQAFANWAAGGKVPGGPPTEAGEGPPAVQPHKPVPPPAARAAPTQYKSIMPGFMEALELPAGPPAGYSRARGNQGPRNGHAAPRHREQRSKPVALAVLQENRPAIIDQEKLQSFDKMDNGDSWTYEDDDFDYNKKLESDEEDVPEEAPAAPAPATDPNWADQVGAGTAPQPKPSVPQPQYNFYDEFKQKGGVGFGVDEEEKRRNKKSEEVMKNIERARQRREEEEARYRRGGEAERQDYREARGQPRHQADQGRRRNYEERERHERERPYEGGQGGGYKRREEEVRGFQGGRVDRDRERDTREQAPWEPREQQPFDLEAEEKRWVIVTYWDNQPML